MTSEGKTVAERLDEILWMERVATPAPWRSSPRAHLTAGVQSDFSVTDGTKGARGLPELHAMLMWPGHAQTPKAEAAAVEKTYANADLIAVARNHLPLLLALARLAVEARKAVVMQHNGTTEPFRQQYADWLSRFEALSSSPSSVEPRREGTT